MKRKTLLIAAASLMASQAHAKTYLFALTGTDEAAFTLTSSAGISGLDPNDPQSFIITYVSGSFYGSTGGFSRIADLEFYKGSSGGGFTGYAAGLGSIFSPQGAQLFSGPLDTPTFTPGAYDLPTNYAGSTVNDHLVITDITDVTGYLFTLTGTDTATFVLPMSPVVPEMSNNSDEGFRIDGVSGSFSGTSGGPANTANLVFNTDNYGGGFTSSAADGAVLFSLGGDLLFTGPSSGPTFTLGSYDFATNGAGDPINDHLTITALRSTAPSVPEVATWAMMVVGFGTIGMGLRRRPAVGFA